MNQDDLHPGTLEIVDVRPPIVREPIDLLIRRSSIGSALRDIEEDGIDSHLAELEIEFGVKRRRRRYAP